MKKKRILILAAHPDDETLGCGATIAKLSQIGHDIELVTFTNGEGARDNSDNLNRNDQLEAVCKILGIKKFSFGDFPDNRMDTIPLLEICKFLETKIKSSPDIIFTHHPDCLNIDHSIVYRSTITVFRPQTKNEIEINSFHRVKARLYIPVSFQLKSLLFFSLFPPVLLILILEILCIFLSLLLSY